MTVSQHQAPLVVRSIFIADVHLGFPGCSADFRRIGQQLRQPVIIDDRNICDPVMLREQGFVY